MIAASALVELITSPDLAVRDRSLDAICEGLSFAELVSETRILEAFRKESTNLYEKARACLFLQAIHRFHLMARMELARGGSVPREIPKLIGDRRHEEAIEWLLSCESDFGPSEALSSALAMAYQRLAFGTLGSQVRHSVRSSRGNQWMFRIGHPLDQPLRVVGSLLVKDSSGCFPVIQELTPVRMDLTHSAWSDIFFLAMDYPAGARVLNVSINLGVNGRDASPKPPVEAYFRVIEEPLIRLCSVDLGEFVEVKSLEEIFDFARDGLGLLKAALIASGLVPPGVEGSGTALERLLEKLLGPGRGIELVSNVNGIPKGSRLAVSTNLLACLISVCMRATGQIRNIEGTLQENDRRLVAARAILGEWIAGSGGGWQDSGGVWPGIKLIEGQVATPEDPEFGISLGALLPRHKVLDEVAVPAESRRKLQDSLVMVHGGMAQNVGPILEMVTERYLLRSAKEWVARAETGSILEELLAHLKSGDIRKVGEATTKNFFGPIQTIIPWASNLYTERIIERVRAKFGDWFWGFWMMGGMSGGGMGFIFDPAHKLEGQRELLRIMTEVQSQLSHSLPFAMAPVVYDFEINENGTFGSVLPGSSAPMPAGYYASVVPKWVKGGQELRPAVVAELEVFAQKCRERPELSGMVELLFDRMVPRAAIVASTHENLVSTLVRNGFDRVAHDGVRAAILVGRIGLEQNKSHFASVEVGNVAPSDLEAFRSEDLEIGEQAIRDGRVAVVTLAGGIGSRWTQGAGTVKTVHPFAKFGGRHRTFFELHVAKTRATARRYSSNLDHVFTTSFLTHGSIFEAREGLMGEGSASVHLSEGRSVGLRMIPTRRDLAASWSGISRKGQDARALRIREGIEAATLEWVTSVGEAADYTDNEVSQCLHPVGTWFEIANMLKNGTLARLLAKNPGLTTLLVHSIDAVGVQVDPELLGLHLRSGKSMTVEVMHRRIEDPGGVVARVNDRVRTIEDLAVPSGVDLSFGTTQTVWVEISGLLAAFGLGVEDLGDSAKVDDAVRATAARVPTYLMLKDVKRRLGHGHEVVRPVSQFEKQWLDMSAVLDCGYVPVSRVRGFALKEQAHLDAWVRDGSSAVVEGMCSW